jgi:hypothetical protein
MDIANELMNARARRRRTFIEATFVMAKGGGAEVGPTKPGNA